MFSGRKVSSYLLVVSVLLIASLIVSGCAGSAVLPALAGRVQSAFRNVEAAVATVQPTTTPTPAAQLAVPEDAMAIVAAQEQVLNSIYERVLPSVVHIRVTQKVVQETPPEFQFGFPGFPGFPFQFTPQQPQEFYRRGEGSGFVWDKEGHIVTNNHVVADADKVVVVFADGTEAEATVLGTDPNVDLAVVRVDVPADKLAPVQLGDSDALKVGQFAVAIGNPFGLENTMTFGIISALGRTIPSGTSRYSIPEVIQTDAPINPGNSGGPLLDREGRVIGINTQIVSRTGANAGIGFAVPINIAKRVVPALIKEGHYTYAWLGISGQTLLPEVADIMRLPEGTKGALVVAVAKGGPADKAGLKGSDKTLKMEGVEYPLGGDVIIGINGQPVESMDDLIAYLTEEARPGDTVQLDVIHANGKRETISVTLGERPNPSEQKTQPQ